MTPAARAQESGSGLGSVGQLLKNFNGVSKLDGVRSPVYTCLSTQKRQRRRRTIPLSAWAPICHPLVDPVTVEVDAWFLDSWPFPDDKARQKFLAAELSRNDRIAFACCLLAILFLIDDVLEYMYLEEGESYNEKLMPLARGNAQPDRKCLVSLNIGTVMMHVCYLILTDEEVAEMREVEMNSAKHISIVNDIYNREKELKQSQIASEEGSILCSGVKVLADSTGFCIESAKACLLANA
ncbi:aristolochene synthase [Colletotrichum asianum]|uniref:Aristolochene synthase n=1 Tax=Colletotrichum asianum TaxID=702518 RepID=A0A8H3VZ17_9PEZI|nr:aristolochene synthase [Colletotrichum asianum]